MDGFEWTGSDISLPPIAGDGWCMRNAICAFFQWPEGSSNWDAFTGAVTGADMDRMLDHLDLELLDPLYPPHRDILNLDPDQSAIACWRLNSLGWDHVIYQSKMSDISTLPVSYWGHGPELYGYIVRRRPDAGQKPPE